MALVVDNAKTLHIQLEIASVIALIIHVLSLTGTLARTMEVLMSQMAQTTALALRQPQPHRSMGRCKGVGGKG